MTPWVLFQYTVAVTAGVGIGFVIFAIVLAGGNRILAWLGKPDAERALREKDPGLH